MATTVDISAQVSVSAERSAGPDWDEVPFEVCCARCGHDLRGSTEPTCSACGLTFTWADAIPLEQLTCLHCRYHLYGLRETRCPECGAAFTWNEVLADFRRRNKPLFEYRWRDRPVRSLISTSISALRPKRFWSAMNMHDPPAVTALVAMTSLCLAMTWAIFTFGQATYSWVSRMHSVYQWSAGSWKATLSEASLLPYFLLDAIEDPEIRVLPGFAVVWCATSLAALMIFRQSMRRYKVRSAHVVRVWAYSVAVLTVFTALCAHVLAWFVFLPRRFYVTIPLWAPMLAAWYFLLFPYAVWALACGYRSYLRMRHSFAVAVAAQVVSVLAAVAICDAVVGGEFAGWLVHWIGRAAGLIEY